MRVVGSGVPRFPWATLAIAFAAVAIWVWPRGQEILLYERGRIVGGEWWRLFTAHGVHWSMSHLGWNLAVFLPAGIWVERIAATRTRWFFLCAPAIIGISLLAGDAALARYAGLSGMGVGVLTLLALTKLAGKSEERWVWQGVLLLLAVKIATEFLLGRALFAHFEAGQIRPMPLAHLAGAACAVLVHGIRRR